MVLLTLFNGQRVLTQAAFEDAEALLTLKTPRAIEDVTGRRISLAPGSVAAVEEVPATTKLTVEQRARALLAIRCAVLMMLEEQEQGKLLPLEVRQQVDGLAMAMASALLEETDQRTSAVSVE